MSSYNFKLTEKQHFTGKITATLQTRSIVKVILIHIDINLIKIRADVFQSMLLSIFVFYRFSHFAVFVFRFSSCSCLSVIVIFQLSLRPVSPCWSWVTLRCPEKTLSRNATTQITAAWETRPQLTCGTLAHWSNVTKENWYRGCTTVLRKTVSFFLVLFLHVLMWKEVAFCLLFRLTFSFFT